MKFLNPILTWFDSHLPSDCPSDSDLGGWFLTPAAHVVEMAVGTLIFTALLRINWKLHHSKRAKLNSTLKQMKSNDRRAREHEIARENFDVFSLSNIMLVIVLAISLFGIVYFKWIKSRMWFMLQPCHVLHCLLIFLTLVKPSNPYATFMFNVYVQLLFSPFLGLVAADVTCYKHPLELANWCIQHVLLLITPLYFLLTHRFPLVTGLPFFFLSFSIEVLYHTLIVLPASMLTGYNINYVLCPPAGILESFGGSYRKLMLAGCAILGLLIRIAVFQLYAYCKARDPALEDGPDVIDIATPSNKQMKHLQKALLDEARDDEEEDEQEPLRNRHKN